MKRRAATHQTSAPEVQALRRPAEDRKILRRRPLIAQVIRRQRLSRPLRTTP